MTYIAELFAKAYNCVTYKEKWLKGFKNTGILPLNGNIFDEEEFTETEIEANSFAEVEASKPPETTIELDPKPWTSIDPDPSYVASKPPDRANTRYTTTKTLNEPKRKRRQRKTSSLSDSFLSTLTEVDNATDDVIQFKSASFEDLYPN